MKRFRNLKSLAIAAVFALGMTSCLDTKIDFQIGLGPQYLGPYFIQQGFGENATFQPFMAIHGTEPLQSLSCSYENVKSIFFTNRTILDTTGFWWITSDYNQPFDTIPTGLFYVTGKNFDGELASCAIRIPKGKVLGNLEVNEFTVGDNKKISASWNKAENANKYFLLIKLSNSNIWNICEWSEGSGENLTSGTFDASNLLQANRRYTFAVAAGYVTSYENYLAILLPGETKTVSF